MECFNHSLETLFQQLGLPSDRQSINTFINQHKLPESEYLLNAPFWTASQKQFLSEAYEQDADWAEQIDILAALLAQ